MNLAVIPARGGSKRIPRKNIKDFCGKPMIAYAIEVALESGIFDKVVVSTDDTEIAQVAKDHGAEVPFLRPAEISDDITPTVPVVAHAVETMNEQGYSFENTCCIYPSVPFLEVSDLRKAREMSDPSEDKYYFPVSEFPSPIQRALKIGADSNLSTFFSDNSEIRTQDLEAAYFDVGQFYFAKSKLWLEGMNVHMNARATKFPNWRAIDIDTPDDWHRAELLFNALKAVDRK